MKDTIIYIGAEESIIPYVKCMNRIAESENLKPVTLDKIHCWLGDNESVSFDEDYNHIIIIGSCSFRHRIGTCIIHTLEDSILKGNQNGKR
jgi:hypothetical protein